MSTKVAYHDAYYGSNNAYGQVQGMPLYYESPQKLIDCALNIDADVKVKSGPIVTGDWFVDSKDKMNQYFNPSWMHLLRHGVGIHRPGLSYLRSSVREFPQLSKKILLWQKITLQCMKNFWDEIADSSFNVSHQFINSIPTSLQS